MPPITRSGMPSSWHTTWAWAMMSGTPGLNLRIADRNSAVGSLRDHASSCEKVGQSAGGKCDSDSERSTVWPRFQANCW